MGYTQRSMSSPFTPKELLELPRPGTAKANATGDLGLLPVSQHSFESNKLGTLWLSNEPVTYAHPLL